MDLTTFSTAVTQLLAETTYSEYVALGGGIALGLAVIGAGWAIGTLGAAALQGSARQPEIQGKLQTMMILAIAFIEALALLAILFGAFLLK